MIPLILFVCLGIVILFIFEYRARKEKMDEEALRKLAEETAELQRQNEEGECCGEHLVCERETLLQTQAEIVYYDDEELDVLAGIEAQNYTLEQAEQIREVFHSLKEYDVAGWVRSMQMRNIQLPMDVREEALLIVVERRSR